VGLDYWITPGRAGGLGSSVGDHFGRLPACSLPAGLPDGAVPGPGVQGRWAPGTAARERCLAPPGRPGSYQPGDRLWLAALSRLVPRRRRDEVSAAITL